MIQDFLKNHYRKSLWRFRNWTISKLALQKHLASGITIQVENYADWIVYNDIFVDGEYDLAIQQALDSGSPNRPLTFLDIGANVGFFTLRVTDLILRSKNPQASFEILLVEGSPTVYKELKSRLDLKLELNSNFKIVHGLVGEQRQGKGKLFESAFHVTNSIIADRGSKEIEVPYVDLIELTQESPVIDLLKCDIEGAELIFIENYQELLHKVNCAIFELHYDKCDTDRCYDILKRTGFVNHKKIRAAATYSVDFFWK